MARIGVAFSGGLAPGEIVECVQRAEELGYESAWVAEGHGGDQFAILAACAVATRRMVLGTSISSVFVRSIPTIAMAAATVDHLSKQRFILGLGSSHKVQVEPEHGIPFGKPVQKVRIAAPQFVVKAGSVQIRHADITENQIISACLEGRETLMAVGRQGDILTAALQQALQGAPHPGFIIDEQNPAVTCWPGRICFARRLGRLNLSGRGNQQRDAHGRPLPHLTAQADGTAMGFDNAAAQG